jgi:hypothetical protein
MSWVGHSAQGGKTGCYGDKGVTSGGGGGRRACSSYGPEVVWDVLSADRHRRGQRATTMTQWWEATTMCQNGNCGCERCGEMVQCHWRWGRTEDVVADRGGDTRKTTGQDCQRLVGEVVGRNGGHDPSHINPAQFVTRLLLGDSLLATIYYSCGST